MSSLHENLNNFKHLHNHTQYSTLDSYTTIPRLVERIKNLKMTAAAVTEHGNLSSSIEFYKECKKQGIKPILGMEAYVTCNADDLPNEEKVRDNRHLVLLATNLAGWSNLIWLNNQAHLHNFYYAPRVYIHHLAEHSEGLIATSACLAGPLAKKVVYKGETLEVEQPGGVWDESAKIFEDKFGEGERWGSILREYFGARFYVEVQDHPNWEQEAYNKWAISYAKKIGAGLVLTCDTHYPIAEDIEAHDLLKANQFKISVQEYREKMKFKCANWIREPEDLYRAAEKMGATSAFWNTANIAEQCDLEIELGKVKPPSFDIRKCNDYMEFQQCQMNMKQ